jgi:pimeloyl-ACP methyl ester carboxylesterase
MSAPDTAPPAADPASAAPQILTRPDGATIAYRRHSGGSPGIVFLAGLRSDMTGNKALFLEDYCRRRSRAYVRFDYFAHGQSSGDFALGTIGRWAEDAVAVLDSLTEGSQILVGSSMGGWLMLLAALMRPTRIGALIGIAPAPDFTEELLPRRLSPEQRRAIAEDGRVVLPSEFDPSGYLYTKALLDDSKRHLLLNNAIPIDVPVRLLHGLDDTSVPWCLSLRLAGQLRSRDVVVTLIKGGDHRLSSPPDLARLEQTLDGLAASHS